MRAGGTAARGYSRAVVALRHVVVLAWVGLVVAALTLPAIGEGGGGDLDGFVPADSPTVRTEIAEFEAFGYPLSSRALLVQRDPEGLSPYTQAEAVLRGIAVNQGGYGDLTPILGALPVPNTLGLFPASTEAGTTVVTYLFMRPGAGFSQQTNAARAFAAEHVAEPEDALVGVTGSVPARVAQGRIVGEALPLVELATLGAITGIVGLAFRAVAAPAIALATAAVAFVVATRLTGYAGQVLGITVPSELEPLILALVLGVATDYAIFFMSGTRYRMAGGARRLPAARAAAAEYGPIVTVAGLTVAAGTAALLAAESAFFRAFGPALALAVLVALVVSVTLVPALLALLGRVAFWPAAPSPQAREEAHEEAGAAPAVGSAGGRRRTRALALITTRPVAAVVALGCVALLALAAVPLRDLRLGVGFVPSLPDNTETSIAAEAAAQGFAPGILAPTLLLLQEQDVAAQRADLARLGDLLAQQPGVAGVVGPGDLTPELEDGVLLSPSGDDARYLLVLDADPLGATAIATFSQLREALPALIERAGLSGARAGFGGDTALATDLVTSTQGDLGRIATAALLVNLALLVLFLRALVAPLYLLACSLLALLASLGLMTYVFQEVLGHDGITFYVPFAAAVLLLSLGSDYNIFGVGHIWALARDRPLRDAVIEAVPQTTRAITAAGVTLAASFGLLALVPLRPFRELALVMAVGILIDAVLVRSVLVPTLLVLVGRVSGWPGRALQPSAPAAGPPGAHVLDDARPAPPVGPEH